MVGSDAEHDLAALMRRTPEHLVGDVSVFQREHSAWDGNQFSAIEESVIWFGRAVEVKDLRGRKSVGSLIQFLAAPLGRMQNLLTPMRH